MKPHMTLMRYAVMTEEAVEEPPAPAAEDAAVEEAPPAEVAAEPVVEAPVAEAVVEAVAAAVEAAPDQPVVVVETVTVETEEPAAPEVPQPTEGAMLTEPPAPAAEQPSAEQVLQPWHLLKLPESHSCMMSFTCMQGRQLLISHGRDIPVGKHGACHRLQWIGHVYCIDFLTRSCGMSEEAAYDAVAAQQAASAIAAKFAQQHAATEGDGPADDLASGKRKYEEDASADPLGDEHIRKRTSFTGPEGAYNGVRAMSFGVLVPSELLS